MGNLVSSYVATATEAIADAFNKLRDDMLYNHDHSTGKGATVDHADLTDTGAMTGFTKDHTDIDTHIGASITDDPGGDRGVHGLPAVAYLMGVAGSVLQTEGAEAEFTAGQAVLLYGVYTLTSTNAAIGSTSSPPGISFGDFEFDSVPVVVAVPLHENFSAEHAPYVRILGRWTTGFSCQLQGAMSASGTNQVLWIAVGPKT